MGRSPCCSKEGLNRGAWTALEDKTLTDYIKAHGEGGWRNLPKRAGLKRCGKSCRLRWLNYLRPDIKRGNISEDEEELIIRLHKLLGNRWSLIAGRLPGRTDNEIKNYWNTNLGKKVQDRQNSKSAANSRQNKYCNGRVTKKGEQGTPSTGSGSASSNVVRTRAIRCSKVVINPKKMEPNFDSNGEAKPTSVDGDCTMNQTSVASISDINDVNSFILDFNMGEYCLSDLLNFDIFDVGDLNYNNNNNNIALSPTISDQALIFSEDDRHATRLDQLEPLRLTKCGFQNLH